MSGIWEVQVRTRGGWVRAPNTATYGEEMARAMARSKSLASISEYRPHEVEFVRVDPSMKKGEWRVEIPPFQSHAPESTAAYREAEKKTLTWRREDIYRFVVAAGVPVSADDYYAQFATKTSGYGTQFALLRRAGYLRQVGRKETRSGSTAKAYVKGPLPPTEGCWETKRFAPFNVPIRKTIKAAIEHIRLGHYDRAMEELEDLVDE